MADPATFGQVLCARWEPGATVVLSCPRFLSAQEVDDIQAQWRTRYPDVHLLLLDGGLRLDGVVLDLPAPVGS